MHYFFTMFFCNVTIKLHFCLIFLITLRIYLKSLNNKTFCFSEGFSSLDLGFFFFCCKYLLKMPEFSKPIKYNCDMTIIATIMIMMMKILLRIMVSMRTMLMMIMILLRIIMQIIINDHNHVYYHDCNYHRCSCSSSSSSLLSLSSF